MSFEWTNKVDGVDYISADDVNSLAQGIINNETEIENKADKASVGVYKLTYGAEFDAALVYQKYLDGVCICAVGNHEISGRDPIGVPISETAYFSLPLVYAVYQEAAMVYEFYFAGADNYNNAITAVHIGAWSLNTAGNKPSREKVTISSAGTTTFAMPGNVTDLNTLFVYCNGVLLEEYDNYTVSAGAMYLEPPGKVASAGDVYTFVQY